MNTERFEERLMHELKNHVEQHAQLVGTEETAGVRPVRNRRVRWVPVGLIAGLTAAAAATTFTLGQSASPDAAGGMAASPRGSQSLGRIAHTTYTLEQEPAGEVKLTIEDPSGKPNVDGMRQDLARMGLRAKVLLGDPNCPSPQSTPQSDTDSGATAGSPAPTFSAPVDTSTDTGTGLDFWRMTEENGKTVAYVDPDKVPADTTLTLGFPLAQTSPDLGLSVMTIGMAEGDGPDCIPAPKDGILPLPAGRP
ncbi:hypothetical protein ABZS94_40455 [Streptomyces sp. NPDC005500]|uniref:hypothetical protein n=1 Tax=Streptomyces sp. NPDC005500 TaxID=3155007 RepID=UPI00339F296F